MDKRLASLPLSEEVLDRTPAEVVALLLRLLSRVEELESRLNKHSSNSDKPPSSDSRRAVQDFLLSVLGIPVSQGAIQKIMDRGCKDEAGKLVRHLMRELDSLWTFLEEPGVAATNNHAERLLRFPVIWRKRSFGTRTGRGEEFVEHLLSFRQTCRLQGKRTYPHLVKAFEKYLSGERPDTLFSGGREPWHSVNPARSLLSLFLCHIQLFPSRIIQI